MLDLALGAFRDHADEFLHPAGGVDVIDDDPVDLVGEEVAHGPLDQVGFRQQQLRRPHRLEIDGDPLPLFQQHMDVADEETGLLALAHGPDDHAHALGQVEFGQDAAQALAFLRVLDLARDAALVGVGHEDEIPAREADVGCDARGPWCRSDPWSPGR